LRTIAMVQLAVMFFAGIVLGRLRVRVHLMPPVELAVAVALALMGKLIRLLSKELMILLAFTTYMVNVLPAVKYQGTIPSMTFEYVLVTIP